MTASKLSAGDRGATTGGRGCGFVTRFNLSAQFVSTCDRRLPPGRQAEPYWIPAENLDALHAAPGGPISDLAGRRSEGKSL